MAGGWVGRGWGEEGHIVGMTWSWAPQIFRLFLSIFMLLCGTGSADPELDATAQTYGWWMGWNVGGEGRGI